MTRLPGALGGRVTSVVLGTLAVSSIVTICTSAQLKPPDSPIPSVFFGLHIHRGGGIPWPLAPFGTWRLWDANVVWPWLEPKRGEWHFEALDALVALAEQHHVEILLPLGRSPTWASARPADPPKWVPGYAAEPANVDDWREYVRTVAVRYKGRVHYYEIWNEPNARNFYTGTVEAMVNLVRVAARELKDVDSSAKIVSPSAVADVGIPWLEAFLSDGGGQYVDIIGFHFYVDWQPPEAMVPLIAKVQAVMAQHGVRDKPLWNTEAGWPIENHIKGDSAPSPSPRALTDGDASAYVARAYVLNWAAGVSRFYWYAWDDKVTGLTEPNGVTPKRPASAYAAIERWLVGARMTSCAADDKGIWSCHLTRGHGYEGWILWTPNRATPFQIPAEWAVRRLRDLSGNQRDLAPRSEIEIGPLPILVERPGQ